jgi:hypothetical protein
LAGYRGRAGGARGGRNGDFRKVEQRLQIRLEKLGSSSSFLEVEEAAKKEETLGWGDGDSGGNAFAHCCWSRCCANELQNTVLGRQTPFCLSKMPFIVGLSLRATPMKLCKLTPPKPIFRSECKKIEAHN